MNVENITDKYVYFQNYRIDGSVVLQFLKKDNKLGEEKEIFPGIFVSLYPNGMLAYLFNLIAGKNNQNVRIDVENHCDTFSIVDKSHSMKNDTGDFSVRSGSINPRVVEYPNNLGGGLCGGCPIHSYFEGIECLSESPYNHMNDSYAVRITRNDDYFLSLCEGSKCYKNYLKIVDNGFDRDLDKKQMIQIEQYRDTSRVLEGKHRICAMKTFGYSGDCYGEITVVGKDAPMRYNSSINNIYDLEKALSAYYMDFDKWGISEEEVRDYLRAGAGGSLYSKGGSTIPDNCKMLCFSCNQQKSNEQIAGIRSKAYLDTLTM